VWKTILVDNFDARDIHTSSDIFCVQMKCKHLNLALRIAMEDTPGSEWMDCCKQAAKELERVEGHTHIGNAQTVQQWHLVFRQNSESFLNPEFHTHGKAMLPPLLEQNPDPKKLLLQHATSNLLNELTAELLPAHLHDIGLPALLEELLEESGCPDKAFCTNCLPMEDLQAKGVLGTGDKKELQQLCVLNGTPVSIETPGIAERLGKGKAKGMLKITFERGFLLDPSKIVNRNLSKIMEHAVDGRNDEK
jgi:hypothetical protein